MSGVKDRNHSISHFGSCLTSIVILNSRWCFFLLTNFIDNNCYKYWLILIYMTRRNLDTIHISNDCFTGCVLFLYVNIHQTLIVVAKIKECIWLTKNRLDKIVIRIVKNKKTKLLTCRWRSTYFTSTLHRLSLHVQKTFLIFAYVFLHLFNFYEITGKKSEEMMRKVSFPPSPSLLLLLLVLRLK